MCRENEAGPSAAQQREEALYIGLARFDACRSFGMPGVEIGQPIEMSEFGSHAADIVPHAKQEFFDLGMRFFRKSLFQIGASNTVFRQQWTDLTHEPSGD